MKEAEIIARLRDGDSQAMEALMQQYGPFLRYILTQSCPMPVNGRSVFRKLSCASGRRKRNMTPKKVPGKLGWQPLPEMRR